MNADAYASTGAGFLGHNTFGYCNNSPVMYVDESGNRPMAAATVSGETYEERQDSFAAVYAQYGRTYNYNSGAAGPYKDTNVASSTYSGTNCFGYALNQTDPLDIFVNPNYLIRDANHNLNNFTAAMIAFLQQNGYSVRKLNNANSMIYGNEIKLAVRVGSEPYPNRGMPDYHVMVQTSTQGRWAEKLGTSGGSDLWPRGMTPDILPWAYDGYTYDSITVYYAIS